MADKKRLIDLDELLRDIEDYSPLRAGLADTYDVKWLVDAQPTVDAVEVVHGRWIRKPIGKYTGVDEVCCSNCGYFVGVVARDAGFGEAIDGFNYCPNCGAKMDGDGNE